MFNRIGISIGHVGKPNSPFDVGASIEQINDMQINVESEVALYYGSYLYNFLRYHKKEAYLFTYGTYAKRLEQADKIGIDLMLHCHVNSGGGSYSLCEYSSEAGHQTIHAAKDISYNFYKSLKTSGAQTFKVKSGERGYSILGPCKASSIILEPFFLDSEWYQKNNSPVGGFTVPMLNICMSVAKVIMKIS